MTLEPSRPLRILDYDPGWPAKFAEIGIALRGVLRAFAARIDHIGSTSVPGLAAKDIIDVQITVGALADTDGWPDELLPGVTRRPEIGGDHIPAGLASTGGDWTKRFWSGRNTFHVHVREQGRLNQRYPLLFRDYLRADPIAAGAYGILKRALATAAPDDWDAYYAVKDPACDLIIAAAEQWALRTSWTVGPSDA